MHTSDLPTGCRPSSARLRSTSSGGLLRAAVEARLLAGQHASKIASCIDTAPQCVEMFARLFFDVENRLGARDWIQQMVLRPGLARNDPNAWRGAVWKYLGYYGGAELIDLVLCGSDSTPGNAKIQGLASSLSRKTEIALRILITALLETPTTWRLAKAQSLQTILFRAKQEGEEIEPAPGLLEGIQAALQQVPWILTDEDAKRAAAKAAKTTNAKSIHDIEAEVGASFRADEMLRLRAYPENVSQTLRDYLKSAKFPDNPSKPR